MNKFGYGMFAAMLALSAYAQTDVELLDQLEAAQAVQEVVNEQTTAGTPDEWHEQKGMLGLGPLLSLVATVVVYHLIAIFGLGIHYQYKQTGKIRWPMDKRWFFGVGRATGIYNKALAGIAPPEGFSDSSDGKYGVVTPEQARNAVNSARGLMKELGITYENAYESRKFDCEDFAFVMKGLATYYMREFLNPDEGAPVALFGYKRDGKHPHVDIEIMTTEGPLYFQPYPDHTKEPQISREERDSLSLYLR